MCAEWDYGGLPTWLGFTPDLCFRDYNAPWLHASRTWFRTVVTKLRHYFPQSGGPVVLVQVENELYGASDAYVTWCGDMAAQELARAHVSAPVIMCQGQSANNTINTCNLRDCTSFLETNGQNGRVLVDQPALLTEMEGGYQACRGAAALSRCRVCSLCRLVRAHAGVGRVCHKRHVVLLRPAGGGDGVRRGALVCARRHAEQLLRARLRRAVHKRAVALV